MTRKIENTTQNAHENPLSALIEYSMPGGIEASERRGQQQLVASQELPSDMRGGEAPYIALGFSFGEPVAGDPMFRAATLPTGWKRQGSDHAMWSYIVDERGLNRVAVFYKAAFYDRSAHMHIVNVGREVATTALYGEGPITTDSLRLSLLTPDELRDLRDELGRMRQSIAEYPDIYGKYRTRLAACEKVLSD